MRIDKADGVVAVNHCRPTDMIDARRFEELQKIRATEGRGWFGILSYCYGYMCGKSDQRKKCIGDE